MTNTLQIKIESNVATLTLNRPAKKNAMSFEMMRELYETGCELRETADLRAIIITGAQGSFCAGIDLADLMSVASNMDDMQAKLSTPITENVGNFFQAPCTVWSDLDVPVIAAIEGVAIGAGAQLALGTDFRIMSPDARIGLLEAKWGLIPDMGITKSLPSLLRADHAMDLMMTGRLLDANEALQMGLVTRVSDAPLNAAHEMAAILCQQSPDALKASKRLVRGAWGANSDSLKLEALLQSEIIGLPHQMEKVAATLGKRPAEFK